MFVLAVLFIFLALAAQFESFVHPLTILLSVPLAITGAVFSLKLVPAEKPAAEHRWRKPSERRPGK